MRSDDATERRLFDLRSSQRHNPERWFPYFLKPLGDDSRRCYRRNDCSRQQRCFFCPHRMKRITFRFQSTWCQSCTTQPPESWFIFWSSLIHMILILFRVLFFLMPQINSYAEIYLTFSHISRRGLFVCLIWIYHFLPVVCILCSQIELLFTFLFWLCIMLLHLSFA